MLPLRTTLRIPWGMSPLLRKCFCLPPARESSASSRHRPSLPPCPAAGRAASRRGRVARPDPLLRRGAAAAARPVHGGIQPHRAAGGGRGGRCFREGECGVQVVGAAREGQGRCLGSPGIRRVAGSATAGPRNACPGSESLSQAAAHSTVWSSALPLLTYLGGCLAPT